MPSNDTVGKLLGVSHATISRYRSGDRLPTIDVMAEIARQFGWSMDAQYAARVGGIYPREFESRVVAAADRRAVGEDAAPNQQGRKRKGSAHTPASR